MYSNGENHLINKTFVVYIRYLNETEHFIFLEPMNALSLESSVEDFLLNRHHIVKTKNC